MAQYGRPDADVSNAATFSPTPLYAELDEITPDDTTTEITEKALTAGDQFEVALSSVTDPLVHTGHHLRFRITMSKAGGDFNFHLYDGTTLIASYGDQASPTTYTTYTINLTTGEAANITNYGNLRCRMTSTSGVGGGANVYVTWIEFECPDAGTIYSRTAGITSTGSVSSSVTVPRKASVVGQSSGLTMHSHALHAHVFAYGNVTTVVTHITTWFVTASVTGVGTVTVAPTFILPSSTTATGTVDATTTIIRNRTAVVVGAGTVAISVSVFRSRTTLSTGAGSVSVSTEVYRPRDVTIVSTGDVTANVTKLGLNPRTADISGTGSVSSSVTVYRSTSSAGVGTVSSAVTVRFNLTATITSNGTIDAVRETIRPVSSTIIASGDMDTVATFVGTYSRTASISAVGTMDVVHAYHIWHATVTATGSVNTNVTYIEGVSGPFTYERDATISATASLDVLYGADYRRQASFSAVGSVDTATSNIYVRTAQIFAQGSVQVAILREDVEMAFASACTLTMLGEVTRHRDMALSGSATLSTLGQRIVNHHINFVPGGYAWFHEGYVGDLWFDDEYVMTDPGGMVGGFNANGRLISRSQIIELEGDANFRAIGEFVPSYITEQGTADFSATGTLVLDGARIRRRTMNYFAEALMAFEVAPGVARFFGEATMTADHHVHRADVNAYFTAAGTLSLVGDRVRNHGIAMTGVATLSLDGVILRNAGYKRFVFIELRRRRVA